MGLISSLKFRLFKGTLGIVSRITNVNSRKIVVDNFFGNGYSDNPKYIIDELLKLDSSLDIVWIVKKNHKLHFPNGIRTVKYRSIKSAYELATAHIWIDNIKNNYKGKKRPKQFYLQTWHGGVGFKKVEKAAIDTLDESYVSASKADSEQTDLMISNSDWLTNNYRSNFWYTGKIVNTGLPRNDIFFGDLSKVKNKVREFYGIDSDTEIILYAPTFRNYIGIKEQSDVCSFDTPKIVSAFEEKFNKKYVLIKRMHPNIADQIPIVEDSILRDGSKYPDMQELLVAAHILITDFSSCAFDFMLKSDKVFLFANDYDNYNLYERKMEFDIKNDLPFSFANNEAELAKNILLFDENIMSKNSQKFMDSLNIVDDGKASERVAKILFDRIHSF